MSRPWVRFALAVAVVTGLFVVARFLSNLAWRSWPGALAETGGASFYVPWGIAIGIARWRAPRWRPPWRSPPGTWRAASSYVALAVALGGIGWLYRGFLAQAMADGLAWPPMTLGMVSGVVLGPFVEEWVFRGLLWRALVPEDPATPATALVAIFATAVVFACWHLPFSPDAPLLAHGIFGALMALVRWRTGSLLAGFVLHGAANALYFVM